MLPKRPRIDIPIWGKFHKVLIEFAKQTYHDKQSTGNMYERYLEGLKALKSADSDLHCSAYILAEAINNLNIHLNPRQSNRGGGEDVVKEVGEARNETKQDEEIKDTRCVKYKSSSVSSGRIAQLGDTYGIEINLQDYWRALVDTPVVWSVATDQKILIAKSAWGVTRMRVDTADNLLIQFACPLNLTVDHRVTGTAAFVRLNHPIMLSFNDFTSIPKSIENQVPPSSSPTLQDGSSSIETSTPPREPDESSETMPLIETSQNATVESPAQLEGIQRRRDELSFFTLVWHGHNISDVDDVTCFHLIYSDVVRLNKAMVRLAKMCRHGRRKDEIYPRSAFLKSSTESSIGDSVTSRGIMTSATVPITVPAPASASAAATPAAAAPAATPAAPAAAPATVPPVSTLASPAEQLDIAEFKKEEEGLEESWESWEPDRIAQTIVRWWSRHHRNTCAIVLEISALSKELEEEVRPVQPDHLTRPREVAPAHQCECKPSFYTETKDRVAPEDLFASPEIMERFYLKTYADEVDFIEWIFRFVRFTENRIRVVPKIAEEMLPWDRKRAYVI
ncbi:uncharacterized protein IL334_007504 [Kwoniella shivajii]|uniref:Uncharacterized protein n=1 Tax=Kwoniella shivajii TaxID=564305 RepID=A0ABZ1DC00_9TREE|nr:hypothetical protein IL334_007504 [Kwoniella shivajii]